MKDGWKTSEFWALVAGSIVTIGNAGFGLGLDTETTVGFAAMVASYILGRSGMKAAQTDTRVDQPGMALTGMKAAQR